MTLDASRSCLGLATSVGSATRQIVDARVFLTVAAPPALPGSSVSNGSPAPPCDAITGLFRSARRRRYVPGDGPDEADQFTGNRSSDDIGRLAGAGELATARAQPQLRFPGDFADRLGLLVLPEHQLAADPGREAVGLGRLDQQPAGRAVAGLGEAAAFDARTARMLGWHQPEIGHQLARIGKAREVAQFGNQRRRIDRGHAAHRLQRRHDRGKRPVRQRRLDLRHQPIAPSLGGFDRRDVVLKHDMMHRLLELKTGQPGRCSLVQAGRP
jgi:hypothetical protein